jgi:hypothetical protein
VKLAFVIVVPDFISLMPWISPVPFATRPAAKVSGVQSKEADAQIAWPAAYAVVFAGRVRSAEAGTVYPPELTGRGFAALTSCAFPEPFSHIITVPTMFEP